MPAVDLTVSSSEMIDGARISELARDVAVDLRREARVVVDVERGAHRPGMKSSVGLDIGHLILTGVFSAASIQAVSSVVRAWIHRRKDTVFTFKNGDVELEIKGTGAEVEMALGRLTELLESTDRPR